MSEAGEAASERRRRRADLLAQRAAASGWRERLLARRMKQVEARRAWVRHIVERTT